MSVLIPQGSPNVYVWKSYLTDDIRYQHMVLFYGYTLKEFKNGIKKRLQIENGMLLMSRVQSLMGNHAASVWTLDRWKLNNPCTGIQQPFGGQTERGRINNSAWQTAFCSTDHMKYPPGIVSQNLNGIALVSIATSTLRFSRTIIWNLDAIGDQWRRILNKTKIISKYILGHWISDNR